MEWRRYLGGVTFVLLRSNDVILGKLHKFLSGLTGLFRGFFLRGEYELNFVEEGAFGTVFSCSFR